MSGGLSKAVDKGYGLRTHEMMTLVNGLIPVTMLDECVRLHRRVCPRQVLGLRMGLYAGEVLGLDLPNKDKRLFTFMETDGCGADGVSVSTGCTVGHRTMRIMDYGKIAATFVDTFTDVAVRIAPARMIREQAEFYAPDEKSRWHKQLLAYQVMPSWQLFNLTYVSLTLPLMDIISRSSRRVECDNCHEEIINQREICRGERILCRACADGGYYDIKDM